MATYTKNGEFCNGKQVVIDGVRYLNPTEEMLLADGWTKVVPAEPSEEELAEQARLAEIEQLKQQLAETDYKAIKYAEGWISEADYAEIKAQRQAWRVRINELEGNAE